MAHHSHVIKRGRDATPRNQTSNNTTAPMCRPPEGTTTSNTAQMQQQEAVVQGKVQKMVETLAAAIEKQAAASSVDKDPKVVAAALKELERCITEVRSDEALDQSRTGGYLRLDGAIQLPGGGAGFFGPSTSTRSDTTLLHVACEHQEKEVTRFLVKNCPELVDVNAVDGEGEVAFAKAMVACRGQFVTQARAASAASPQHNNAAAASTSSSCCEILAACQELKLDTHRNAAGDSILHTLYKIPGMPKYTAKEILFLTSSERRHLATIPTRHKVRRPLPLINIDAVDKDDDTIFHLAAHDLLDKHYALFYHCHPDAAATIVKHHLNKANKTPLQVAQCRYQASSSKRDHHNRGEPFNWEHPPCPPQLTAGSTAQQGQRFTLVVISDDDDSDDEGGRGSTTTTSPPPPPPHGDVLHRYPLRSVHIYAQCLDEEAELRIYQHHCAVHLRVPQGPAVDLPPPLGPLLLYPNTCSGLVLDKPTAALRIEVPKNVIVNWGSCHFHFEDEKVEDEAAEEGIEEAGDVGAEGVKHPTRQRPVYVDVDLHFADPATFAEFETGVWPLIQEAMRADPSQQPQVPEPPIVPTEACDDSCCYTRNLSTSVKTHLSDRYLPKNLKYLRSVSLDDLAPIMYTSRTFHQFVEQVTPPNRAEKNSRGRCSSGVVEVVPKTDPSFPLVGTFINGKTQGFFSLKEWTKYRNVSLKQVAHKTQFHVKNVLSVNWFLSVAEDNSAKTMEAGAPAEHNTPHAETSPVAGSPTTSSSGGGSVGRLLEGTLVDLLTRCQSPTTAVGDSHHPREDEEEGAKEGDSVPLLGDMIYGNTEESESEDQKPPQEFSLPLETPRLDPTVNLPRRHVDQQTTPLQPTVDVEQLREELDAKEHELQAVKRTLEEHQKELQASVTKADALQKELEEQNKIGGLTQSMAEVQDQLATVKQEAQNQAEKDQQRLAAAETELRNQNDVGAKLRAALTVAEKAKRQLEQTFATTEKETKTLRAHLVAAQTRSTEMESKAARRMEELDTIRKMAAAERKKADQRRKAEVEEAYRDAQQDLTAKLAALDKDFKDKDIKIRELDGQLSSARKQSDSDSIATTKAQERAKGAEAEKMAALEKVQALEKELAQVRRDFDALVMADSPLPEVPINDGDDSVPPRRLPPPAPTGLAATPGGANPPAGGDVVPKFDQRLEYPISKLEKSNCPCMVHNQGWAMAQERCAGSSNPRHCRFTRVKLSAAHLLAPRMDSLLALAAMVVYHVPDVQPIAIYQPPTVLAPHEAFVLVDSPQAARALIQALHERFRATPCPRGEWVEKFASAAQGRSASQSGFPLLTALADGEEQLAAIQTPPPAHPPLPPREQRPLPTPTPHPTYHPQLQYPYAPAVGVAAGAPSAAPANSSSTGGGRQHAPQYPLPSPAGTVHEFPSRAAPSLFQPPPRIRGASSTTDPFASFGQGSRAGAHTAQRY